MAFISVALPQCCSRQMSRSLSLVKQSVGRPSKCMSNVCADRSLGSPTSTDPLDNFTNKLVHEKTEKWKSINTMKVIDSERDLRVYEKYQNGNDCLHSDDVDVIAINELIRKSIDTKKYCIILSLLNICKTKHLSPSSSLLLEAASVFSRTGNKTGVEAVRAVCKISNENEYFIQAEFKHYIAEATWVNGNIDEALEIFDDVYKHYPALRRRIRNMAKYLIVECVTNKSEASVVLVTNFAKKYAIEFKDFYFLASLWQYLFLSEWFADNKVASELLEQYSGLRTVLADRIQYLAAIALAQGESEVVQKLCEIALCYDMRKQYTYILRSFFDYKCSKCDLKGCREILTSAKEVNVSLTRKQYDKFLSLLLDNQHSWYCKRSNLHVHKELIVPTFQLKF